MTLANLPSNFSCTSYGRRRRCESLDDASCSIGEPATQTRRQEQQGRKGRRTWRAGARLTILAMLAILTVTCSNAFTQVRANNNNELEVDIVELELEERQQQRGEEEHKAPMSPVAPPQLARAASSGAATEELLSENGDTHFDLSESESESYNNQTAQQQQQQGRGRGSQEQVWCKPNTEFWCQLDNRCVPIEWHCDFTEQCLDGQDELGCAPEWCNFEHGLCNWRNEPSLTTGNLPGIWRRFQTHNWKSNSVPLQNSFSLSALNSQPTTRLRGQQAISQLLMLEELLDRLAGNTGNQQSSQRFLFVTLTLTEQEQSGNNKRTNVAVKQSVSAHFKSPVISQTDSMCQVRFKYALWAAPIQAANNSENRQQQKHEAPTLPRVRLNLSLIARQRSAVGNSEEAASSNALNRKTGEGRGRGGEEEQLRANNISSSKILWSKSIEAPLDVFGHVSQTAANSDGASKSQREIASSSVEWLLGVAELGHLRQIELDFEAKASLVWPEQPGKGTVAEEEEEEEEKLLASSEVGAGFKWKVPGSREGAKSAQAPTFGRSPESGQQQQLTLPSRHDSLVAIEWVKFQGCSWPQLQVASGHRAGPAAVALGIFGGPDRSSLSPGLGGLNELGGWRQSQEEQEEEDIGAELAGPSERARRNLVSACEARDFHCSANNICLLEEKLCNFVNDCMNDDYEHYTYTNADGNLVEATGLSTLALAVPFDSAPAAAKPGEFWRQASLGEDELPDLCQSVAGMESFEAQLPPSSLLPGEAIAQRGSTGGVGEPSGDSSPAKHQVVSKFWSLSGNWPQNRIRLERGAGAASGLPVEPLMLQNNTNWLLGSRAHLPSRDHTPAAASISGGGHYLSFEIPVPTETLESAQKSESGNVEDSKHHSNISSRFRPQAKIAHDKSSSKTSEMGKTIFWIYLNSPWMEKLDNETGDCRTKFFYNVVSSTQAFSLDSQGHNLPHKIYLSVEHFVATSDTGDRQQRIVDSFVYSHQIDCDNLVSQASENCGDPIEYPGVDFWREVNVKLAGLSEGDLFYIRIGVFVELSGVGGANLRASVNIDDLSTHFGCAPIDIESDNDEESSLRMKTKRNIGKVKQNVAFDFGNFIIGKQHEEKHIKQYEHVYHYSQWKKRPKFNDYAYLDAIGSGNEPHKLIICVFGVLFVITSIILAIVFFLVPYVERITISYHDQLSVGLSEMMRNSQVDDGVGFTSAGGIGGGTVRSLDSGIRTNRSDNTVNSVLQATTNLSSYSGNSGNSSNRSTGSPSTLMTTEACEFTTESDWERISRQWRQSAISESFMTDSVVTMLDSQSYSQRIDSLDYLPPISLAPAAALLSSVTPSDTITRAGSTNTSDLNETVSRTPARQQQQVLAATTTTATGYTTKH